MATPLRHAVLFGVRGGERRRAGPACCTMATCWQGAVAVWIASEQPPPPGSEVRVMSGSVDSLLDVVGEVGGACLGSRRNAGVLLAFSCAARACIFGARAPEEARRLQDSAGDVPTFGFYCCGEFARTTGVLGTHNATLTAIAL
jgi:hypothetical protein